MPLSYFPPLPETVWGNLSGNIELQMDLIELIGASTSELANKKNFIINPNFRIWQRCSNQLEIVNRSRSSNITTLETDLPHGYMSGDTVQITSMNDSSYDDTSGAIINVIDDNHFSYANIGSDETDTTETLGVSLLLSRKSVVASDSEFIADRWIILNDSSPIVATPATNGIKLQPKSTNKFGILQIIPADYLEAYKSEVLSLSSIISTTENSKAKIALLSWTGSKDSTTNDAISSWNAEGTNPTLLANWQYEAISEEFELDSEYQNISLGNQIIQIVGTKNIALFIWFEELTIDEVITIDKVQITNTAEVFDFKPTDYETDLNLCRRFFQKSYGINIPPNQIDDNGKKLFPTSYGTGNGNSFGTVPIGTMYKSPDVLLIAAANPPIAGNWQVSTGTNINVSAIDINENSFTVENNAGFTISTTNIAGHYTCSAEI